jgi:hypothetical protein
MQGEVFSRHPHERGQTIILVAVSIVSLLAMAALAIDIVTLYVASSEIQRAADAAALSAAKAIADSGFTTLPSTDPNFINGKASILAQKMATASINAMIANPAINLVGGQLPVEPAPPVFDFATHPGSYQVTVSLKSASLPTFFSRIWARTTASVTATATAEAYNPSNLPIITPIAPRSVKPWLVANSDPTFGIGIIPPPFVTATGVEINAVTKTFNLTADCQPPGCTLKPSHNPPTATPGSDQVDYVPGNATPTNPNNVCPPCAGASDYEQTIACADANSYAVLSCGGGTTNATWNSSYSAVEGGAGLSASGAECLTHASTSGKLQGQDTLNFSPWPDNPMKIKAESGPETGNHVTTSNSIVTIPIIDNTPPFPAAGQPLTVVGFMQAFINQVQDGTGGTTAGDINITVLNIAGCSAAANTANPVVGVSGTSPIPVRLIKTQ